MPRAVHTLRFPTGGLSCSTLVQQLLNKGKIVLVIPNGKYSLFGLDQYVTGFPLDLDNVKTLKSHSTPG